MQIEIIETESLGNRGYLIHDGKVAVAIDVQRDYQRWADVAARHNTTITHVFETHMHNDYVTGGFRLAESSGAHYIIPAHSGATFDATLAHDGDSLTVGSLIITALHTPGHTEHHMSYRITDGIEDAVFTGGGILYGTVGRTDLVAPDKTESLTNAQYDSAQRLLRELDDQTAVFPTHGFGSFCSSSAGTGASSSTIASEKMHNIAFTSEDRTEFIQTILAGLGPYPRYYAHMGAMNQAGPAEVAAFHLHDYSVDDITRQLQDDKTWVIDLRQRKAFAAHHPEGAAGIELGKSFSTYTGWLVPWGEPMMLVGDDESELQAAYVELSRIGMEQFVGGGSVDLPHYLAAGPKKSYQVVTFADLKDGVAEESPYVLDVRLKSDWTALHVTGSVNIPLHELQSRMVELPDHVPIWVHCASGYRASVAASLVDNAGKIPVLINDSFDSAVMLGLTLR